MFDTVFVANRAEIAVRIMRTLRRLGIRCAVGYSDPDANARHVEEADVAVRLGPAAAAASYLNIAAVLEAARSVGAQAVHPGYGFLAEDASFARACERAGLVFVGPPAAAIEAMGDKIRAKRTVEAAGVPVVPGRHQPDLTDEDLIAAAREIGFPVLLKPSAGGGGKGMRRVTDAAELPEAIASARREARGAFADDTLLVERWVDRSRHIEVQILADSHGTTLHLGERECSLQRRHQKVVEEAPSPLLSASSREAMGGAAVRAAAACGYVGAGTVEFIVAGERPEDFFFMEMNTRLQVEHPVTELITGLDLVEEQLRCAAGERLGRRQEDIALTGHAVEARIYAEDPARDFLPTGGRVLALTEPRGDHVRVDSGLRTGAVVGTDYDPMLAKVVAWGEDRPEAMRRLDAALAGVVVLGVVTNTGFLRALLADPDVAAGRLDTGLVDRRLDHLVGAEETTDAVVAAALGRLAEREAAATDPFEAPSGWRIGEPAWTHARLGHGRAGVVDVRVRGWSGAAEVRVGDDPPVKASAALTGNQLTLTVGGRRERWSYARDGVTVWVGRGGRAWSLREVEPAVRAGDAAEALAGPVLAPMPGTVTAVHVVPGQVVTRGRPLAAVEAMKMEHVVRAQVDATVAKVLVQVGQAIPMDAPLMVLEPARWHAPEEEYRPGEE